MKYSNNLSLKLPEKTDRVNIDDLSEDLAKLDLLAFNSIYRQAIINGNFDIWQRGTSFTANGYTADRWQSSHNGTTVATVSRLTFALGQTVVPNNPKYSIRKTVTSASGQSYNYLATVLEGIIPYAGKTWSISFWAKSDQACTGTLSYQIYYGVGGTATLQAPVLTFNLTTSWTKFTVTFDMPSVSGKTIGTGGGEKTSLIFSLPFNIPVIFDLAQVQMNVGDPLPFMPKSFGEELLACMRYYEKSYNYDIAPGTSTTGTVGEDLFVTSFGIGSGMCIGSIYYKVPKRGTPAITLYSRNGTANKWSVTGGTDANIITSEANARSFKVVNNTGASITAQNTYGHWTSEDEL